MTRRPPSQAPELPGYTFVRVLGSGGFSDVFLYEQKLPKRRVAVKVLLTEELSTATRASFVAEANLMAQLSAHPYIVTIFHADVASDDRPYFVMEYCSGPSLAESYKQQTMAVSDALRTGVRLSSAIATAHSAGILHRDIKPANVLTNDYGWPALTDFGISSAVDDEILSVHTGTLADALAEPDGGATGNVSVGMSVPWSPPEMFEDDPQPDIRSDVFSLAATLYTVLAGRTPFEVRGRSNGALDLIGRIERGDITPMDRSDLPRSLLAVLQKGMASDRAERFTTVVDFARALQRVELELGYSPTALDVPNLQVDAPQRNEAPDDADATSVRSVATVHAQPTPAAQPSTVMSQPSIAPAQPSLVGEQTIVRSRVAAAPASELASPESESQGQEKDAARGVEPPASRANRLVLAIGGIVGAIILIAIVVSLTVFGAPGSTGPTAAPGPSGAPAVVAGIPTPELLGTSLEGSNIVFSVENPEPEPDDTFRWRISNGGNDERYNFAADGRIVVEGFTGQRVCVEVLIVRAAAESSNALDACYPE